MELTWEFPGSKPYCERGFAETQFESSVQKPGSKVGSKLRLRSERGISYGSTPAHKRMQLGADKAVI